MGLLRLGALPPVAFSERLIMGNPISVRFDSSIPEPSRHIFVNTLFYQLNQDTPKINANIKTRIRDAIREAMFSSPEIRGPIEGGVTHKLTKVIDTWTNNISLITTIGKSSDPLLSISVGILRDIHNDIPYEFLGFSTIEGLRWLMLGGDKTIVTYNFVREPGKSRSLRMERKGRTWTIPIEVRGQHNFALHMFPQIEKKIDAIVKAEVEHALRPHRISCSE